MTRRVALLGKPLRRRHSQVMHDAAFAAAGIDAHYELLELDADAVEAAVAAARGPEWLGLGVTAPYKRVVAGLCDEVEPDASAIGAVNNVVRTDDGTLIGFNSDAPGFRAGVELARRFEGFGSASARPLALDDPAFGDALRSADLAVNATTVGMVDPGVTIEVDRLPPGATVFDLVYVPVETPLLQAARARGLRAANGSEMLIQQAAIAFERWTGVAGMAGVMRDAVAPLLADTTVRA